jgi:hypothetical protein
LGFIADFLGALRFEPKFIFFRFSGTELFIGTLFPEGIPLTFTVLLKRAPDTVFDPSKLGVLFAFNGFVLFLGSEEEEGAGPGGGGGVFIFGMVFFELFFGVGLEGDEAGDPQLLTKLPISTYHLFLFIPIVATASFFQTSLRVLDSTA